MFLLYANAVLGLLFGNAYFAVPPRPLVGFLALGAFAAGGYGIANERRWGYQLAVAVAAGEVLAIVAIVGIVDLFRSSLLLTFAFAVALVALLLHPQSREYQRIWFR